MRKTTSLRIETKIWNEAKKEAIDKEITISEYIEHLIKRDINNR